MVTREDNLKMIFRSNGSKLIEFEDGTRITRFYDEPKKSSHSEFKNSQNNSNNSNSDADNFKTMFTKIECPGFATTVFNSKSAECNLILGSGTVVKCDPTKCVYNVACASGESIDASQDGYISFCPK
jgi:hypothetical protein